MNLHTLLTPARKILTVTAVTLIATAALGSAATSTSATAGQHRSDHVSATKEWKVITNNAGASRTKEW